MMLREPGPARAAFPAELLDELRAGLEGRVSTSKTIAIHGGLCVDLSRMNRVLEAEHGEGVSVMRALKHALDPDNLLNPGKVLKHQNRSQKSGI